MGLGSIYTWSNRPQVPKGKKVYIKIESGGSMQAIASEIQKKMRFFPTWGFRFLVRWYQVDSQIKSGYHILKGPLTPSEVVHRLTVSPPAHDIKVRIRAGWTKWDIADELSRLSLVDRRSFIQRVDQDQLEGRLFPETYHFHPKSTLDDLIHKMTSQFENQWKKAVLASPYKDQPEKMQTLLNVPSDPTRLRLINLASFIERESAHDADRPLIARVFFNRLAQKMKLQSDPSCVYSELHYTKKATRALCRDLKSTYSTYVIKGLPPTPIANPSFKSLHAVLNPDQSQMSEKLLFFVAKRDGSRRHFFSEDYATHHKAVLYYLKGKGTPP